MSTLSWLLRPVLCCTVKSKVRLHTLSLGFLYVILALSGDVVWAKKETSKVEWAYCIYPCGESGEFDSAGGALGAWNEMIDQGYSQCMGSSGAGECGGGCSKVNSSALAPTGGFAIINGISTLQRTHVAKQTTFVPACGQRQAQTIVKDIDAPIGVAGRVFCPAGSPVSGSPTYVVIDGSSTSTYSVWCEQETPDPPSCKKPPKPMVGDPVSPIDGTQIERETDYVSVNGMLRVDRTYSSGGGGRWTWGNVGAGLMDQTGRGDLSNGIPPIRAAVNLIPPGIYSSGSSRPAAVATVRSFSLIKSQPDVGQKEVFILRPDGSRDVYTETQNGTFTNKGTAGSRLSVATVNGNLQWTLRESDGFSLFDSAGRLIQRVNRDGKAASYAHSASAVVVSENVGGRSLSYLKASNQVGYVSVTLPDNAVITYDVDELARVKRVTYTDLSAKTYVYDEPANTGSTVSMTPLLTGIIDENAVRIATFKYDQGRSISNERAGELDQHKVTYSESGGGGTSTVRMPISNAQSTMTWDRGPDGERRLLSQSQPAGAGCAASTRGMTYDVNGNMASADDFNGTRKCLAYDLTRDIEVTRVEGLAANSACTVTTANAALPAGSRKTSKQWHPDWSLETKVAEPGRITTNVYNGQPDPFNGNAIASCAPTTALLPDGKPIAVLCKRVEQATTDANGAAGFSATLQSGVAARTWKWTYNEYGQVLTEDGPRTDVNDVTTYAYYSDTTADHTKGDLKQVTNAMGKVTQYTKYNKHGQVLESVDPNAVLTVNTYDPRLRLLSTTVGGQTTSYKYDAAGQLKKVTLPDMSFVGYDYDDAHRLIAVYDNNGNRTDYELDNAGNRKGERTKDPAGNLKRQLTRSLDALGRIQQTTGRE